MGTHAPKSKNYYFSNLYEKFGIGWIERKIKFQIFILPAMVIFVTSSPQFSMNFHDISKKENLKIKLFRFSFYSAHSASLKKNLTISEGGGSAYPWLGRPEKESEAPVLKIPCRKNLGVKSKVARGHQSQSPGTPPPTQQKFRKASERFLLVFRPAAGRR